MKFINFKRDNVFINVSRISGIDIDENHKTVDIYIGDDENCFSLNNYKYNEVISAVDNLLNSDNQIIEVE